MRITEGALRRIIRRALLHEAMMTPDEAERRSIRFKVNQFSDLIEIAVIRDDDDSAVVGMLQAEKMRYPCLRAWEITKSNASIDGLGPLMYDLMIDLVHPNPLSSDRSMVSKSAKSVWDYYMNRRSDIEVLQLDNLKDELTPGLEDDNCDQHSAELQGWRELRPWTSSPLSKAYRRKDGGTPLLDELQDLGIIEIEER